MGSEIRGEIYNAKRTSGTRQTVQGSVLGKVQVLGQKMKTLHYSMRTGHMVGRLLGFHSR